MGIPTVHLSNFVDEAGLIVFCHWAAAPVHIHVRRLLGAHGHHQLLLVVVVLLVHLFHCDVGVRSHEPLDSALLDGLAEFLRGDIPQDDLQRLIRQLQLLCQGRETGQHQRQSQDSGQQLFHTGDLLVNVIFQPSGWTA